jgi:hypothetical protein
MRRGTPCPPGASGHAPCRTCPAAAARCPSSLRSVAVCAVTLAQLSALLALFFTAMDAGANIYRRAEATT